MRIRKWMTAVVGVACAALATLALSNVVSAQQVEKAHKPYHMMHKPEVRNTSERSPRMETVTLEIRGANTKESARMLASALTAHQVNAPLEKSTGKPVRVTAAIDPQTDLGAIGEAVRTTRTPDKAQAPPSLDLVLFGKFDQATVKKAADALAKIKGIDAKDSTANISGGEYTIRVQGGAKVTANQIHRALESAGVWTQFTRTSSARKS